MTSCSGSSLFCLVVLVTTGACGQPDASGEEGATVESPAIRTLSEQEVVDMLVGSCIQATRACDASRYIERARERMAQGTEFTMIAAEDIPDDWMVIGPAGVGGGGAWEHVIERTREQGLSIVEDSRVKAIQFLADYLETEFRAVLRVEPAGATLAALMTAADLGVPVVDACMSGRARPEIQQQIPWIQGIPSTPTALVTRWGDSVLVKSAVDDYRSEDLARAVAVSSGGGSSIAMNPMSGAQVKVGTITGNLSEAILLGRTVREAREAGRDPVEALVEATNGYLLFRGVVSTSESWGDRGFSWTEAELTGTGDFEGHTYSVFVKNENIVSWLDGVVDVTSPDYIWNLNPETGEAMTSDFLGGYPEGTEVAMVGVPSDAAWRVEKGIEVLGPRHFGFDFDFTPIEELQAARSSLRR